MRVSNDVRLAEAVPEVHLILGGHDHHYKERWVSQYYNKLLLMHCASIEERERARNEINIISNQVIANVTGCNGTRHVAFINMTDTSCYNCPTSHHIPRGHVDDHT